MRKLKTQIVYISIGSNLGDRKKYIQSAVLLLSLSKGLKIVKVSKIIETKPQGGPRQGDYLNVVIKLETNLPALKLLMLLNRIEDDLGRERKVRFGPRTIDLDILLYGDKIIRNKKLTVPHPRMFERVFVLKPLLEIEPDIVSALKKYDSNFCYTKSSFCSKNSKTKE